MKPFRFYHETLTPQVNAVKTRSYYIPFPDETFSLEKRNSDRVTVLDRWKFAYYPRYREGILDAEEGEEYLVPFVWQLKGFDYNQYTNFFYPVPFDPPYIRKDNPCGVYRTDYEHKGEAGRQYVVFDGVDSCLYLFVNGAFAGYSTVSHSSAEFEITDLLVKGKNRLTVLVFKWCSGTYLEDQDKIRFSGIFRDVYVIRRPHDHITDYKITTEVAGEDGNVRFVCDKAARVRLFDGERLIADQTGGELSFKIENARLWSAETPELYRMVVSYNGEFMEEFVGIRSITIENSVFKINGKPVKFKGVNRHSMTEDGYVETAELMEKDLQTFAAYNINAVRTSHYPPHPVFVKLCDVYGIYVLEEADIETHGLETIHYYGDPTHFDDLANDAAWKHVYLHRQERMYERDKNRQCIIMWSLGNEAGWGENFKACSRYLRSVDGRPLHYEGNTTRTLPETEWRDAEYLDVASMMYPCAEECKKRIDRGIGRPFMLCEYTHAMGNSCGDVEEYWNYIYSEERFCGAFVWEWCDHTVLAPDGRRLYGGDFNEAEPCSRYDGNFCADGLVDTNRRPHPSLDAVKEAYAPVDAVADGGSFTVINRYDFLPLDGLTCLATVERNGHAVNRFPVDLAGIGAREKRSYPLPETEGKGYETLNFAFTDGAGRRVATRQILLSRDYPVRETVGCAQVERIGEEVHVRASAYRAVIGRDGMLASFESGKESFRAPSYFSLYRRPIDNDLPLTEEWRRTRLEYARVFATEISVAGNTVAVKGKIVADIVEPLYDFEIVYTAYEDGLQIDCKAKKRDWIQSVARFGFCFVLDGSFAEAEYFGRGPGEAYPDRLIVCPVGRYRAQVKEMNFDYLKAQDSGARCGCRSVSLFGQNGAFTVQSERDFSFTATPYEIRDYKNHSFEMNGETGKTVLHIDYKTTGVGSAACGAPLKKEFTVDDQSIDFSFRIIPFRE